jgi:hypothetical protein
MKRYFEIQKLDEELRMVWGYASTETVDAQGETVSKAAMQDAWDDYMQFGNIREMHKASAVGVVKEYAFDDVGLKIGAHIVDDAAWAKVTAGVYKGFSIGGKKLPGGFDAETKTITKMKLTEISLVDRPCNPEALIEMFKVDGEVDQEDSAQSKLLALISKGDVSVERLLELAEKDSKVETPSTPAVKTAVQKLFASLADTGSIEKAMYSVGRLASLIDDLKWLTNDCAYEAEYEGDKSPIPGELAAAVSNLAGVLVRLAQEEVSELVASLNPTVEMPAVEVMGKLLELADKDGAVAKVADALDVVKVGARNSTADAGRIQKAHDLLAELGAACDATGTEKVQKSVGLDDSLHKAVDSGRIQKALQMAETVSAENGNLRKMLGEMSSELDDLKKRLADSPVAPKGVLKAIEKGDDVDPSLTTEETPVAVRKVDGSVDETATAIMKIHASGGRRIF